MSAFVVIWIGVLLAGIAFFWSLQTSAKISRRPPTLQVLTLITVWISALVTSPVFSERQLWREFAAIVLWAVLLISYLYTLLRPVLVLHLAPPAILIAAGVSRLFDANMERVWSVLFADFASLLSIGCFAATMVSVPATIAWHLRLVGHRELDRREHN